MLFSHRLVRTLGVLTAASAVLSCGAASASAAASLDVTAQCAFPVGGVQPVSFTVTFPAGLQAGDTAPGSVVTGVSSPGFANLGATVEYARNANHVDVTYQGASSYGNPYPSADPFSAPTYLNGTLPVDQNTGAWLTYPQAGTVSAQVTGLTLDLRAYNAFGRVKLWQTPTDSDHNPETVDVPCTLDAGQTLSTTFAVAPRTRPVDTTAPSAPGPIAVSNVGRTAATFAWGASSDDQGVDRYDVIIRSATNDASIPVQEIAGTGTTIRGLKPDTTYTVSVKAFDRGPNASPATTATFSTHRLAADQPFALALSGGGTITTSQATATLPLSGTLTGVVAAADDSVTGKLELAPATVVFKRTDGLTVTTTATFTAVGPTTGIQTHGPIRLDASEAVSFGNTKLTSGTITVPLPTPATCRLALPAHIALTSGDSVYDPTSGGALSGTATLGRLSGCAALSGLIGNDLGTVPDLFVQTSQAT